MTNRIISTYFRSNPNSPVVIDGDSDSQKTGSDDGTETKSKPPPSSSLPPMASFGEELQNEERELWTSILNTARRCSMIPLGQDRVYR